jgi:hypothetical protein
MFVTKIKQKEKETNLFLRICSFFLDNTGYLPNGFYLRMSRKVQNLNLFENINVDAIFLPCGLMSKANIAFNVDLSFTLLKVNLPFKFDKN